MTPTDTTVEITHRITIRVGLGAYQHCEVEHIQRGTAFSADAAAKAEEVREECEEQVWKSVQRARAAVLGEPLPETGDKSHAAFQKQARKNREEENPFEVTDEKLTAIPEAPFTVAPTGNVVQSGEQQPVESKTQTKPRERRKVAEMPVPAPAQKQTTFAATDADLPEALSAPQAGQRERIDAAIEALAAKGNIQPSAAKDKIREFMRAWLNTTKLPMPPAPLYDPLVPFLESMVLNYSGQMLTDPHVAGLQSREGYHKLLRETEAWPIPCGLLAVEVAAKRFPDFPEQLLDVLKTFTEVAVGGELMENITAFLLVYPICPAGAMKLREVGVSAAQWLEQSGLDLNTATAADVMAKFVQSGERR